jgi:Mor family transcriptional regulator
MNKPNPSKPAKQQAPSRRAEVICEIEDQFVSAFEKNGKPKAVAEDDAKVAVEALVFMFGGQNVYIPFDGLKQLGDVNASIRREFTGHNHADLARKFSRSVQHVYRVVKRRSSS